MIPLSAITAVAKLVGRQFHAEQVVLFGSYARREATEDSDVDLLVITEQDSPGVKLGTEMRRVAAHFYPMPLDLVLRSRASVEQWRAVPYSLVHEALREGSVLYDRRTG